MVPEIEAPPGELWYSVLIGTTRVVVEFAVAPSGEDCVLIWALTNIGVEPTLDLYSTIARSEAPLGAASVKLEEDGTANVVFSYTLPVPETLDERQFRVAFELVARASDELDDVIQTEFGGRLANDPLDRFGTDAGADPTAG
jgi:hypothetical protein